jgi:hypothetical protein
MTIFVVDYGAPDKVLDMIKNYPYSYEVIQRTQKYGLTINILEGMRECFHVADDYVIYIEDDILLHKTYFQYIHEILYGRDLGGPFSVISAYNQTDGNDPSAVYHGHHYAALAPCIMKYFWEKYISQVACEQYYKNPPGFVTALNEQYKAYWGKQYKYKDYTHWEQAGILNRLVDAALIEENMYVLIPKINRQQHIGYFGKNRPGGVIPGDTYDERIINLHEIILDANKMYKLSATPQYNDYKTFSPRLDEWYGHLNLVK